MSFFLFFIALMAWILGSIIFWTLINGISPMPTTPKVKNLLLKNLPNYLDGTIYELGSGWGTLAFALAKKYPQATVIALETSPIPFWTSKAIALSLQIPNLKFIRQNFFEVPLNDAALVVCYLYPGAMSLLKTKLEKELSPETWVVSNTFAMPGWQSAHTYHVNDLYHTSIYFYQIQPLSNHLSSSFDKALDLK